MHLIIEQVTVARERLAEERNYLNEEIRTEHDFEAIVGQSPALKRILKQAELVAPTGSTVLDFGRNRHGEGSPGAGHPRDQPKARTYFCECQLRCNSRGPP